MKIRTILASASPRRRELIKYIDENIEIIPSNINEKVYAKIMPKSIPEHLALKKAFDIAEKNKGALVIGCDTCVFIGNEILGKPKNREEAKEVLTERDD